MFDLYRQALFRTQEVKLKWFNKDDVNCGNANEMKI